MTAPINIKNHRTKDMTQSDEPDQDIDGTKSHVTENNLFNLTFAAIKNTNHKPLQFKRHTLRLT